MNTAKLCMTALVSASLSCATLAADDEKTPVLIKDFGFSFSPAGTEVTYYSYRDDALPDIYKRRGHGAEVNLTNRSDTWDIEPNYSPDGKFIVYTSGEHMADLSLWVMKEDGSSNRLLYDGPDNEVGAKWSPDGSKILFTSFDPNTNVSSLYVMDRDGRNARHLAADLSGQASGASWSANSERILFAHRTDNESQRDIYRIRADGSGLTRLTHDTMSQSTPVYSPDESRIIFIGGEGENHSGLYSIPAGGLQDGQEAKKIVNAETDHMYFLTYGPGSDVLVYSEGDWTNGFSMGHTPTPKSD